MSERFEQLLEVAPDGSRVAFFEDSSLIDRTAKLVVVSIPDGARLEIPAVPTDLVGSSCVGRAAALSGREVVVYLDHVKESGADGYTFAAAPMIKSLRTTS